MNAPFSALPRQAAPLRNRRIMALVLYRMDSIWRRSNLGLAIMLCSPVLASGLGWEAFFPVALCSILGGALLLLVKTVWTHMFVAKLTAELAQDLIFADKDRRDWVLGELTAVEERGPSLRKPFGGT